jgi:uncharacterized protein (DUF849 family)
VREAIAPILMFADDMVLMAASEEELNRLVDKVRDYCTEWKLEVNVKKTKVMVVSKDEQKNARIRFGQEDLECVKEYTYLGTVFTADGKWGNEITSR